MTECIIANTNEEYRSAALLFKEYATGLNIDLSFQHFDDELFNLKTMYSTPEGGLLFVKPAMNILAALA